MLDVAWVDALRCRTRRSPRSHRERNDPTDTAWAPSLLHQRRRSPVLPRRIVSVPNWLDTLRRRRVYTRCSRRRRIDPVDRSRASTIQYRRSSRARCMYTRLLRALRSNIRPGNQYMRQIPFHSRRGQRGTRGNRRGRRGTTKWLRHPRGIDQPDLNKAG